MFRVIHPNRWFFWTIAILLAIGLGLLVNVYKASEEFENQASNLAMENDKSWKRYSSAELGITLRYPHYWQIEIDREAANTVSFQNPEDFDENITISAVDPKYREIIRNSLSIASESKIEIGGNIGTRIESKNPKDTAVSTVILVEHEGKLYEIAGQAEEFERIVNSIRFN